MSRLWSFAWLFWVAWFLVWEVLAIAIGKQQYTLSYYIWRLEGLGRTWTFVRYTLSVMCVWLFFHITFGWFK